MPAIDAEAADIADTEEYEVHMDMNNKEFAAFLDSNKALQEFHYLVRIKNKEGEQLDVKLRPFRNFNLEKFEGTTSEAMVNFFSAFRSVVKKFKVKQAKGKDKHGVAGQGKVIDFDFKGYTRDTETAATNM